MKRIGLSKSKKMEKIDIVSKSLAKKESRKVETGKFIKPQNPKWDGSKFRGASEKMFEKEEKVLPKQSERPDLKSDDRDKQISSEELLDSNKLVRGK